MEGVGVFFSALVLAFAIEAILEYVFGIWWKPFPEEYRPRVLMAVGLILGIGFCLAYGLDLIAEITSGLTARVPYLGQVITGALVGRGSSFLHDFVGRLKH